MYTSNFHISWKIRVKFALYLHTITFTNYVKVKVKCTLVQALRLCTGRTAYRGTRGIALPFHDHGTRRGWGVSVTSRPLFTPQKDPVSIVQEAGWTPGPVGAGAENLTPIGSRSPDRPDRSQSLYRMSYPVPFTNYELPENWFSGIAFTVLVFKNSLL